MLHTGYSPRIRFFILFSLTTVLFAEQTTPFNSIRIAHLHYTLLNDSLLDRVKRSGYNYATVPLTFRASNLTVGDGDFYANFREDVCSSTVALDRFDIRIIPLIPMSSRWALQWKMLQMYENPSIGMNTVTANDDLPAVLGENPICQYADSLTGVTHGSNSWGPEPDGVDKSVRELFTAINDGFTDAQVDYPLEYVHIQHDEPQVLNRLLMGGIATPCGTTLPFRGNFARGETSAADSIFINEALRNGHSLAGAYQLLLADELFRRATQAKEVFGSGVKLMFFAESFDFQSWGNVPWHVNFGDTTITICDVIDLPGLDEAQKNTFKKQLIPMLWNFDGKNPFVKNILDYLHRSDYDSDASFSRFAEKGFRFLYIGALQNGEDSRKQIIEYANASRNFPDHCLGYMAAAWDIGYDTLSPDKKWDILEYMPSVQNSTGLNRHSRQPPSQDFTAFSTGGSICRISFVLSSESAVTLDLFTPSGKQAASRISHTMTPGSYIFRWKQTPGLYLVRLTIGRSRYIRSITVIG